MAHFDMNPDNLDPRVRQTGRAGRRRSHRDRFGTWIALIVVADLAIFGGVVYVAAHFITKFW